MARYLISFSSTAMDHIPEAEMPAVDSAAHAVMREAQEAGVWIFGGGLDAQPASIVATDGAVSEGPYPDAVGGFSIIEVSSREEAFRWAAKIGVACRCAQEVREIMYDPLV